jgi:predicted CopG family antitoxin
MKKKYKRWKKMDFKTIKVSQEVWLKLAELKKFPERGSFNDVISWLIEAYDNGQV